MAKLKGPLFSLGATQKLGNALVFFGWKGLNVVREYVIPANPKSAGQSTQRGYMIAVVAAIHAYQALATNPFASADALAYALLGSTYPTPRTWFNQVCKAWIDLKVKGKIPAIFGHGSVTPGTAKLTVILEHQPESSAITEGKLHYGTSKTALIHSVAATILALKTGVDITGLTKGVKYFIQFRSTLPTTFDGNRSGIYYGVPI